MTARHYRTLLRNIVSRCHITDSNRTVIRYAVSRLRRGSRLFFALPRTERRDFMRACIQLHAANRRLYKKVQQR